VTARTAAELVGVSRPTATLYYQKIRQVICYHLELESEEYFAGEVELDESYFTDIFFLFYKESVAPSLRLVWRFSQG
jgi:transposase-like protein